MIGVSVSKKVRKIVTEASEINLTAEDICQLLRHAGYSLPSDIKSISVQFTVPGGGDWSNTDVPITASHPVHVSWSKIETEESDG